MSDRKLLADLTEAVQLIEKMSFATEKLKDNLSAAFEDLVSDLNSVHDANIDLGYDLYLDSDDWDRVEPECNDFLARHEIDASRDG